MASKSENAVTIGRISWSSISLMSEGAEVVPSGVPDWEEVFAGLSSVTAHSPANLAGGR